MALTLLGQDVLDRANVPGLDQLEIAASRFEQAHQGGHAHVPFGEILHPSDGRARNACPLRQRVLTQPSLAASGFEHLGNIGKCCHCGP